MCYLLSDVFLCNSARILIETSRRDDMHQFMQQSIPPALRGYSRALDTHAVSYHNYNNTEEITRKKRLQVKEQIGSSVKDRGL